MNIFSKIVKWFNNRKEIKQSDLGRKYGWYIEHEGKVIGELKDHQYGDNCDSYLVVPVSRKHEEILFDPNSWSQILFKFRNKKLDRYVEGMPGGYMCDYFQKSKRIDMKYLFILKL